MDSIETTEVEAVDPGPLNPLRTMIVQAVARGWCTPKTQHLEMDSDLALAIADQVVDAIINGNGHQQGAAVGLDSRTIPNTTDAWAWTEEFLRLYVLKKRTAEGSGAVDDAMGVMLGWFANSIMAGWDEAARRAAPKYVMGRLFNAPLGTRFRYRDSGDVWVLLSYEGSGLVAAWSHLSIIRSDNGRRLQSVCSAAESREEFEAMLVEIEVAQ